MLKQKTMCKRPIGIERQQNKVTEGQSFYLGICMRKERAFLKISSVVLPASMANHGFRL